MKTTHTHRGHCQICGRLQAAHNVSNTLAKHGYTVDFGFFNGVCPGAEHLPFEKSCDLIPPIAARLDDSAIALRQQAASIREFKAGFYPTHDHMFGNAFGSKFIRKNADGTFQRVVYEYLDAWQRKAGRKPEIKIEDDAVAHLVEYFKYRNATPAECSKICEEMFRESAERRAKELDREAQRTDDFAAMLRAKVATFIPNAPLVPVEK